MGFLINSTFHKRFLFSVIQKMPQYEEELENP